MSFFSNLVGAAVKTVLTPIAVAKDAVSIATGDEATATKDLLESAGSDLADSVDDLADGEII